MHPLALTPYNNTTIGIQCKRNSSQLDYNNHLMEMFQDFSHHQHIKFFYNSTNVINLDGKYHNVSKKRGTIPRN